MRKSITMFHICVYLFALLLVCNPILSGQQCTELNQSPSAKQFISYLRNARALPEAEQNPDCILAAIKGLAHQPSAQATEVLIQYLDFRRPLTDAEKQGFRHASVGDVQFFPATETLFTFGRSAVDPLVTAIKSSSSGTVQRNAALTLLLIFPDDPARPIQLLKKESDTTTDVLTAERLRNAIEELAQWCSPPRKAECEAAATSGEPGGERNPR